MVTLSTVLGVSMSRSRLASPLNRRWYFSATRRASADVERSGTAGPDAIMSSGSPMMSERTTEKTRAGEQRRANRPPLTAESRLRMVLISTISAPQPSSWPVISCNSAPGISGLSNSALPPPERRKRTVSPSPARPASRSASSAARKEFSSGVGWPASSIRRFPMGGPRWPYLVMTTPSASPGTISAAAAAIR